MTNLHYDNMCTVGKSIREPEKPSIRRRRAFVASVASSAFFIALSLSATSASATNAPAPASPGRPVVTSSASSSSSINKPPKGGWVIGFEEGFCANSWRKEMLYAFNLLAASYERQGIVKKTVVTCANGSISGQIANINTMIAEHVNALLLIANSGSAVVPVVTKATEDGIVTVPFNLPLTGGKYDAYIGTNPCLKAQDNARNLVNYVKGLPGGIVALGGIPGNSYTEAGWACAKQIIDNAHIPILTFKWADWEPDEAKAVMSSVIAAYPHISGIWSDGSQNCQGAEEALLSAGRPLVSCTGDDYNGYLKLWVRYHAKYPHFHVSAVPEPPAEESTEALKDAIALLEGEHVPHITILHPPVITDANVTKYVQMGLPDSVFVFSYPLTSAQLRKLFA
jgi:ribose transport system substrate-binding protein